MAKEQALPMLNIADSEHGKYDSTVGTITASGQSKLLQNFGTLNAQNIVFTSGQEREKIKAGITVPFARDDKFVIREGIFDNLDAALSPENSQPWAALYGLGGIGKSQIAIEYSYRVREIDSDVWVFWIACNNTESLMQSFRKIAQRLALPGHDSPQSDVLELVESWLCDDSNGPWLMILDNVDDIEVLCGSSPVDFKVSGPPPARQPMSYIPQKCNGRVLVTSRDEDTASKVVPLYESLFKVDFMSASESLALLRCRIPITRSEEDDARELVETLEYIPLAISQAGAYIRQMRSLITIKGYLKHWKESESKQAELLQKQKQEFRRSQKVPSSIILAWAISFEQIKNRDEEAANMLCLVAMLYRQNIPLQLIDSESDLRTLEILTQLEAFSFITISESQIPESKEDDKVVSLHRLIQLAVRKWLELHDQLMEWKVVALKRLAAHFDTNEPSYEILDYNNVLALHADEVLNCETTTDPSTEINRALVISNMSELEYLRGNAVEHMEKASIADNIFQQYCEEADEKRWRGMARLGAAYLGNGRFEEAETTLVDVSEQLHVRFGPDNINTLTARHDLGLVYWQTGRYKQARNIIEDVLQQSKAIFGMNYDTLLGMNNLALVYQALGQYDKAVDVYTQILKVKEERNQAEAPDSLAYVQNLANVFRSQGRLVESERIHRHVSAIIKTKLGADHPHYLKSLTSLVYIFCTQHRYTEAEEVIREFLDILEQSPRFGRSSRHFLNCSRVSAVITMALGRTDEAFELLRKTIGSLRANPEMDPKYSLIAQRILEMWIFEAMAGLEYSVEVKE